MAAVLSLLGHAAWPAGWLNLLLTDAASSMPAASSPPAINEMSAMS